MKEKITAVIITKNEEKNISKCLDQLQWVDEVVIIDDFSSDRTEEYAKCYNNIKFYKNKFMDFSSQRNFGISKTSNEWILSIDSDEVVSDELRMEILNLNLTNGFVAYKIPTKNFFWGKWLKHGGWYPDYHIRLFNKTKTLWRGPVHEIIDFSGDMEYIKYAILHKGHNTVEDTYRKILRDTPVEAVYKYKKGVKFSAFKLIFCPLKAFVNRYFLKMGFCDGVTGLGVSIMMAVYNAMVWLKIWEMSKKDS